VQDPHTGKEKKKKKLGGASPGQRRPEHAPYVPPQSQFQDGKATVHFVATGGGNALTLVQQDGSHQPQIGKPQTEFIQGKSEVRGHDSAGIDLSFAPACLSPLAYRTTIFNSCCLAVTLPDGVVAGQVGVMTSCTLYFFQM
jgi:hypothetical protein